MSSSLAGGKPWNLVRRVTQRHLTGHFHSTEGFVHQKFATSFVLHDMFIFFRGSGIFLLLLQQDINCTLFFRGDEFSLCSTPKQ